MKDLRRVFQELHVKELSHTRSIDKNWPFFHERYHFRGMKQWLKEELAKCPCAKECKVPKKPQAPMKPVEVPMEPGSLFGLDMIGPFVESHEGFQYSLNLIDYTSNQAFMFPMRTKEMDEVLFVLSHPIHKSTLSQCSYLPNSGAEKPPHFSRIQSQLRSLDHGQCELKN